MKTITYAALDLGSNSFRLEIALVGAGVYQRLNYVKRTVRLGAGLDAEGQLSNEAMERGWDCLAEFARALSASGVVHVRAVATQALREARNAAVFLAKADTILGFPVEVIAGREEARLIYQGVLLLQPSTQRRLVVDIGGRSTEVIVGQSRKLLHAESMPVGSVSQSQRFFADGTLNRQLFDDAVVAARAAFEDDVAAVATTRWELCLGSSGTMGAVSDILKATGMTDGAITRRGLEALVERVVSAGHLDRMELPGLKEDRRPVLAGGLSVLAAVMASFRVEEVQPARGALRQGVIYELSRQQPPRPGAAVHDVRVQAVRQTQRRFSLDTHHAEMVRRHALTLWDSIANGRDTARLDEARKELAWSCELHEIGRFITHEDHHKVGSYVTSRLDMAGFARDQLARMAVLILAHRGGLRKVETHLADLVTAQQILCIRMAVLCCHAREPHRSQWLPWSLRRKGVRQIEARWLLQPGQRDAELAYLFAEELKAWTKVSELSLSLDARS